MTLNALQHAKVYVDNRCIDMLLTQEEITKGLARALDIHNNQYLDTKHCCDCWPVEKPPKCNFWNKVLGLCSHCRDCDNE